MVVKGWAGDERREFLLRIRLEPIGFGRQVTFFQRFHDRVTFGVGAGDPLAVDIGRYGVFLSAADAGVGESQASGPEAVPLVQPPACEWSTDPDLETADESEWTLSAALPIARRVSVFGLLPVAGGFFVGIGFAKRWRS